MRFNTHNIVFINDACVSECCRRKEIQLVLEKWPTRDLLTRLQVNNGTKKINLNYSSPRFAFLINYYKNQ
jgi:hypothetical protein